MTQVEPEATGEQRSLYNRYGLAEEWRDGRRVVRKRFPPAAEGRWRVERAAYQLLNRSDPDTAPQLLDAPGTPGGDHELVMAYVPGDPLPGGGAGPTAELYQELGRTIGRYHATFAGAFGDGYGTVFVDPAKAMPPQRYWLKRLGAAEPLLGKLGVSPRQLARLTGWVAELADMTGTSRAPTLVHRDLRPPNLLVSGGRVVVIDWEVSTVCHPGFDLARLFLLDAFADESIRAAFVAGYGPLPTAGEAEVQFFRLLLALELLLFAAGLPADGTGGTTLWDQAAELFADAARHGPGEAG